MALLRLYASEADRIELQYAESAQQKIVKSYSTLIWAHFPAVTFWDVNEDRTAYSYAGMLQPLFLQEPCTCTVSVNDVFSTDDGEAGRKGMKGGDSFASTSIETNVHILTEFGIVYTVKTEFSPVLNHSQCNPSQQGSQWLATAGSAPTTSVRNNSRNISTLPH